MFIFFVNKPITIIPYLLGLGLCLYSCMLGFDPSVIVFVNIFNFSLWYTVFLIRYYVLSGQEETVLWKVNINKFKGIFNCYLILNVLIVALVHIRIIYYFAPRNI